MSRSAENDLTTDQAPARFVVGIDLGTTNSAVCYVDTDRSPWQVDVFPIPQLVAPAQIEARDTLPSFHYQPAAGEFPAGSLKMPWDTASGAARTSAGEPAIVGFFARDAGAKSPGRLISSAKSWLCHSGVDRTADLLPWRTSADIERLSPVEVSGRYLRHIRRAWDHRFGQHPLEAQDIVLTLPASFDEVARELTVEAARRAGLTRLVLIEEPQAAFYAWIYRHGDDWRRRVELGQKILVCDIGGGTSDFTLIRVRQGEGGAVQFHRTAVGEHLILGGDNLDLALAHHLEGKLAPQGRLEPRQWDLLVRICRSAKEQLLSEGGPASLSVNLPTASSKLIGGALQALVSRDEAHALLVDGFFPYVRLEEKPTTRQSGFQEFGLPYAADPAVTRHLAAFLTAHRHVDEPAPGATADPARPDVVLFNGGVFASRAIQDRLLDVLSTWFPAAAGERWRPDVLSNPRLDLAVAQGAAYFGMVRRGQGVRIAAGLARSYYVGVERPVEGGAEPATVQAAVCLAPGNAEPGQTIDLDRRFELVVSQPVEFPLFVSSVRLADRPGDLLPIDLEQMRELPPIRTVLRSRRKNEQGRIGVTLHARLSEIGTLELWCAEVGSDRSWRLEFDVRSATQTDRQAVETSGEQAGMIEEAAWAACESAIEDVFGDSVQASPDGLVKRLAELLGMPRGDWPPSLLRRIWQSLHVRQAGRRKSAVHEARWLNLLGYALRPGYGVAVDDWRVAETWRAVQGKLVFANSACRNESWILFRRIAGGLSAGQQRALADPLLAEIRAWVRRLEGGKSKGDTSFSPAEAQEAWRLLGALEWLPASLKVELGGMLLGLAARKKLASSRPSLVWAVGRLGARSLVYGPLNTVVAAKTAAQWMTAVMALADAGPAEHLAVMQLARRTGDRHRDLDDDSRRQAAAWLEEHSAATHLVQLVREGGSLARDEQNSVFGEALPRGLRIG